MKDITAFASTLYGAGTKRYAAGARWFHWVTALLIFTVIPLGWIFAEFKTKANAPDTFEAPIPGSPADYAALHKLIGLLIFVIVVARIVYRIANPPPPLPGRMAIWEKGLAHASHWLLYAVIIIMPVSGYILASASKHPIPFFGLFDVPKLPIDKDQAKIAGAIHLYVQFAVYALVALHVVGTAWHLVVRRDALLDRMLPRQANAD
jgi:cytochrome b561